MIWFIGGVFLALAAFTAGICLTLHRLGKAADEPWKVNAVRDGQCKAGPR